MNDHLKFKICLIGCENVGKTSIVKRLVDFSYTKDYTPTVGIDFITKSASKHSKNSIRFQLWDTSGQERFSSLLPSYYRNSSGFIAVYDITNKESFNRLKYFIECAKSESDMNAPVILIGNKCELEDERQVFKCEAEAYARSNDFLFLETSAKCDINVSDAFEMITDRIVSKLNHKTIIKSDTCTHYCQSLPKLNSNTNMTASCMSSRSHMIDANCNSFLVGNSSVSRSVDIENRSKSSAELLEQVKLLKAENERKNKLIVDLTNVKDVTVVHTGRSCQDIRSEFTESKEKSYHKYLDKYEALIIELNEERARIKFKDELIDALKIETESLKTQVETVTALNQKQSSTITELEVGLDKSKTETASAKSTMSALENQIVEIQNKIKDYEATIKTLEAEKESKTVEIENSKISTKIQTLINIEITDGSDAIEFLVNKYNEKVKEVNDLNSQLVELNKRIEQIESTTKENNENTQRAISELNKFEKETLETKKECEKLTAERNSALFAKQLLEAEISLVREKFETAQTNWLQAKYEMDMKEKKYISCETKILELERDTTNYKQKYDAFLEQVAILLTDDFVKVGADESVIKEKLALLMTSSKDRGIMISTLESRIQQVITQLTEEIALKEKFKLESESNQKIANELKVSVSSFETRLNESQNLCTVLTSERNKLMGFVDKFSRLYKLNVSSTNLEEALSILFGKIESIKNEYDAFCKDKKSTSHYEQKIAALNEEISNKDIHLNLLRKKVVDLEEAKFGRSEIKQEIDTYNQTTRHLSLKIERLTEKFNSVKNENTQLKSQLLDLTNIKTKATEQESEIAKLKSKIEELESEERKYLTKIGCLRDEIDSSNSEINQTKTVSDKTIKQMGLELRMLKQENEKLLKRERDLMDFRESVAKKCGLNISLLNVADLDILSRIEYVLAPMQTVQAVRSLQMHSVPITQISNCCAICHCLVDKCNCNVNKHYSASESSCRHSQEVSSSSNCYSTGITYCTKN